VGRGRVEPHLDQNALAMPAMPPRSELGQRLQRLRLTPDDLARGAPVPHRLFDDGPALNRVCRPDAWDDPEWRTYLRALDIDPTLIHRKAFEWTQLVFGLERLGMLGPDSTVLGVGAGHERVLYYLANRSRLTVATDLYGGHFVDTPEQEAAPDFLRDPGRYAPFPYREDRLVAMPADGLHLPFAEGSFDVVYSLSSIEHFGGPENAALAMQEKARVLKPGGVAVVATELVLEGPANEELFAPDILDQYVLGASALVPIEELDDEPPPRELFDDPVVIGESIDRNPHIVMGLGDTRWTSVVAFLRKPTATDLTRLAAADVARRGAAKLRRAFDR
jgi:SAM-dependent methyltransferase